MCIIGASNTFWTARLKAKQQLQISSLANGGARVSSTNNATGERISSMVKCDEKW